VHTCPVVDKRGEGETDNKRSKVKILFPQKVQEVAKSSEDFTVCFALSLYNPLGFLICFSVEMSVCSSFLDLTMTLAAKAKAKEIL